MNKYLIDFTKAISDCQYTNTYKMAWAKSIVELSILTTEYNYDHHGRIRFTLEEISERCFHYYWNQTIFFDLVQGSNLNKPPTMISEVKKLIAKYQEVSDNYFPIVCTKVDFSSFNLEDDVKKLMGVYTRTLKKDVSFRFTNLSSANIKYLYMVEKDAITFSPDHIFLFRENHSFLFQAINYRWSQMLEGFNLCPKISTKVKAIHVGEPKRKSLNTWKQYLDLLETAPKRCFYTSKELQKDDVSIDHVIPWSFMYSDDLWNLVYCHRSVNSKKSNRIPTKSEIERLKQRNIKLYQAILATAPKSKAAQELKLAIDKEYEMKFWLACKG